MKSAVAVDPSRLAIERESLGRNDDRRSLLVCIMSDSQPVVPLEPTSPPVDARAESVPTSSADSATPAVTSEPIATADTKPGSPLEHLAQTAGAPASWLWLTKLDQTFVAVFVAVFLLLTGYHWATLGGWGMRPIELERHPARQYDFRFDINSASWVEWTQIEGIGEVTAQKIIADRDAKGPFRKIDDLLRVKGIGPKTLEKMRPFLLEPNERPMPKKSTP